MISLREGEIDCGIGLYKCNKVPFGLKSPLWKLITTVRKIKVFCSGRKIPFVSIQRSANRVADFFAKNGVDSNLTGVFHI